MGLQQVVLQLSLVLTMSIALGCTGSLEPVDGPGGDGDADASGPTAQEMQFRANVEPLVALDRPLMACAVCHIGDAPIGGAIFGANIAASYALIRNNYAANPAAGSLFVTKGTHTGNAFCTGIQTPYAECSQDEVSIITAWIDAEIAAGNIQ